jgi:hypothetical protein
MLDTSGSMFANISEMKELTIKIQYLSFPLPYRIKYYLTACMETGPSKPAGLGCHFAAVNMPSAPLFCGNLEGKLVL